MGGLFRLVGLAVVAGGAVGVAVGLVRLLSDGEPQVVLTGLGVVAWGTLFALFAARLEEAGVYASERHLVVRHLLVRRIAWSDIERLETREGSLHIDLVNGRSKRVPEGLFNWLGHNRSERTQAALEELRRHCL